SPDGKYLASASDDNTVKLWNFNREELLKYACNGLSGYLKNNPNVSDNKRSLCGVESSATAFLLEGDQLAENGKIDEAITKFEKALELDPSLEFDPQAKAIKLAAPFFVSKGMRLVFQGNVDEALTSYKKAQELDPNLEISANSWNVLCWRGSLYNQADKVMFACEKALELKPDHGNYIDSRGLARALTGNRKGAIEDFEQFIKWTDDEEDKAQRQGWVDALKKGENPFTKKVLESLR
ncbi:MAG: tetratricopeptide repeat protein, partial [Moorea sp. SIO2I5]|nr:tetratricopeptide repeat protein [Moorena sp. SIO2I5]